MVVSPSKLQQAGPREMALQENGNRDVRAVAPIVLPVPIMPMPSPRECRSRSSAPLTVVKRLMSPSTRKPLANSRNQARSISPSAQSGAFTPFERRSSPNIARCIQDWRPISPSTNSVDPILLSSLSPASPAGEVVQPRMAQQAVPRTGRSLTLSAEETFGGYEVERQKTVVYQHAPTPKEDALPSSQGHDTSLNNTWPKPLRRKGSVEDLCVRDELSFSMGSFSHSSADPFYTPVPAFQKELKELKGSLELQYKQQQHFGTEPQQQAMMEWQLVHRAVALAPDNKVRELCATLACQKAQQDIILQTLAEDMKRIQKQMQCLGSLTGGKVEPTDDQDVAIVTHETLMLEDLDITQKSAALKVTSMNQHLKDLLSAKSDPETQEKKNKADALTQQLQDWQKEAVTQRLKDEVEERISQQEHTLKGWIAEFFALATRETIGSELKRHETTIKSLQTQVESMNEFTKNGLKSLQKLLCEAKDVNANKDNDSPNAPRIDIPKTSDIFRKLHTITETIGESDTDNLEVEKKYQEDITEGKDIDENPERSAHIIDPEISEKSMGA